MRVTRRDDDRRQSGDTRRRTGEACRIPPDAVRLARASTIVTLGHGEDQVAPQDSGREGRRTGGGAAGRAVCRGKARQTDFLGGDRLKQVQIAPKQLGEARRHQLTGKHKPIGMCAHAGRQGLAPASPGMESYLDGAQGRIRGV